MDTHKLGATLAKVGVAGVIICFFWWMFFYAIVNKGNLNQAIPCLFYAGGTCQVVTIVARASGYIAYEPFFLWINAIVAGIGLAVMASSIPAGRHAPASVGPYSVPQYDRAKWAALVEYDKDIAEAAKRVGQSDPAWVHKLAADYLALNDKQYLQGIVTKIIKEAADAKKRGLSFDDLPPGSQIERHFRRRVAFLPDDSVIGETDIGLQHFSSFKDWRTYIGE
jgi:hypothetical protein